MILLDDKLISEDIIEKKFACNIGQCKGACCVKGDAGAPLIKEEVDLINEHLPSILDYVKPEHIPYIKQHGFFKRNESEYETNCLPTGECVFVNYKEGIAGCGIEDANRDLDFKFQKPISCHLYPIRVSQVGDYTALNYHHWDICNPACQLGEKKGVFVYRFLKKAIIRAFGKPFYELLEAYSKS